jgi:ubiquinone/menaquinone biosynthesis C-methylase UbiE
VSEFWSDGDFSKIAAGSAVIGETLADDAPVYAGQSVLAIGCGSANAAISAGRRKASVIGVEPVEALLAEARRRSAAEGLDIDYRPASAEAFPVETGGVDLALSGFGLIFREVPEAAVAEAARVLRPGGKLVFTAWKHGSLNDRLFALCERRAGWMPSIATARAWGREERALRWLTPHFASIRFEPRVFRARALSLRHWLQGMKAFLAPVRKAYEGLEPASAAAFDEELLALGARFNEAPGSGFYSRAEYLTIYCNKRIAA